MEVIIKPGKAKGTAAAPPSKSYAHRLIICAALSHGTSTVRGVASSQDILATLDCIAALGAQYDLNGDTLTVHGGLRPSPKDAIFPCRESGSTMRFFLPLAMVGGGTAVFTGTPRLIERGISVYESLLPEHGVQMTKTQQEITVSGKLTAGAYTVTGDVSSQFISGLLFALPLLEKDSTLRIVPPVESRPYVDITVDAMRRFGLCIDEPEENLFYIRGGQSYHAGDVTVEGDWSNAAALFALNLAGGDVAVTGLNEHSIQGDRVCRAALEKLTRPGAEIDLTHCPDLGPVLFAVAAANHGAVFTGTRRLRIKESDRAAAMAQELAAFGIRVDVQECSVTIYPGALKAPERALCAHNDHRIVMALAVLCCIVGGRILEAQAVEKSYPNFFTQLQALGIEVDDVT